MFTQPPHAPAHSRCRAPTFRRSAVLLASALAISACGGGSDADSDESGADESDAGTSATVVISDFSYGEPLRVTAGTSVEVTNTDGVDHTWTAEGGSFDTGIIGPDESVTQVLDEAGQFTVFCTIHSTMSGTVEVTA